MGRGNLLRTQKVHKNSGFTIVELLIVVVVIAILAAITAIAYTGVTIRATASATQSAAETAAKKVSTYAVTNSDQVPTDLTSAGITNSGGTTYQYTVNTTTTPQTYCITATTSNVSYYIDNISHTNPTAGACPGHGLNGVAPITNWDTNPSVETSTSGYWIYAGTSGAATASVVAGGAQTGSSFMRATWTKATTADVEQIGTDLWPSDMATAASYTFSIYVRQSFAGQMVAKISNKDAGNGPITVCAGSTQTMSASTWTRLSVTCPVPSGVSRLTPYIQTVGSVYPGIGDYIDIDGVMLTTGTTLYNYADGNSSNWVWNGTTNLSTSIGSPL